MYLNKAFFLFRKLFWTFARKKLIVGKNVSFSSNTFFSNKGTITIGDNFYCGPGCYFSADLKIGENVLFGANCAVVGGDHKIDNISTTIFASGRDELKPTIIESDVWVGHGSIILHGVTIKSGTVIGAGSVVTKSTKANEIIAGNPAQHIRYRNV